MRLINTMRLIAKVRLTTRVYGSCTEVVSLKCTSETEFYELPIDAQIKEMFEGN